MTRILKFTLDLTQRQTIWIPAGSRVLSIQPQRGVLRVWAECADPGIDESRIFWILETGDRLPDVHLRYHATIQMDGYVRHVYEEIDYSYPAISQEQEVAGHFYNLGSKES